MGFKDASTIPLVSAMVSVALFRRKAFGPPWEGVEEREGNKEKVLSVYGASGALG
jgi:hypothetical protein